jgi:hypothetical protein
MYMFFLNADDLTGLDIANGQCYNQSIAQNLTFGYQGLPFGLGDTPAVNGSANGSKSAAAPLANAPVGLSFVAFVSMLFWQVFL